MLTHKPTYNVAVVGATGAVGLEFLRVLAKRRFPMGELRLLASKNSVGKTLDFDGRALPVHELTERSFEGVDIALFSAGGARSKGFAAAAVNSGAVVIDNSSAFRMDPKVPLVVPEINPEAAFRHQGIIANPNCTTIIMGVAIYPVHKINPIKRIVVASYQAVSGAGAQALEELRAQVRAQSEGREPKAQILPHVIANNVFSHNSAILENGYNEEEMKMVKETHKIFGDETIQVSPTCVRVPIERAHSEAIHLELERPVDLDAVRAALQSAPGVLIVDDSAANRFPMPREASGQDAVLVGRIRRDPFLANGLNLFVSGDQLLKGAALNAVQIAELLVHASKRLPGRR